MSKFITVTRRGYDHKNNANDYDVVLNSRYIIAIGPYVPSVDKPELKNYNTQIVMDKGDLHSNHNPELILVTQTMKQLKGQLP